jgi:hypothetical protein
LYIQEGFGSWEFLFTYSTTALFINIGFIALIVEGNGSFTMTGLGTYIGEGGVNRVETIITEGDFFIAHGSPITYHSMDKIELWISVFVISIPG